MKEREREVKTSWCMNTHFVQYVQHRLARLEVVCTVRLLLTLYAIRLHCSRLFQCRCSFTYPIFRCNLHPRLPDELGSLR